MRKFKIRKVKTTRILTISPEFDRVQQLTKFSDNLKRYSTEDMPEINTIRSWVNKELVKNLAQSKIQNLFPK